MYNDPNQPPQPPPGNQWGSPPPQPPYGQPGQQWNQSPPSQYGAPPPPYAGQQYGAQPPYAGQQYGAPPNYPNYMPPPAPKKSRRWLWITLGIVGGILLLGCVGCGIFVYAGAKYGQSVANKVVPAITVTSYYQAIERQDYTTAYSYLDSNLTTRSGTSLTQTLYTTAAQGRDTAVGMVTSYSIGAPSVNNNTATVTVTVKRGSTTYNVHLGLTQVNGDWKISSYDNI